jgi:hypothetical protein
LEAKNPASGWREDDAVWGENRAAERYHQCDGVTVEQLCDGGMEECRRRSCWSLGAAAYDEKRKIDRVINSSAGRSFGMKP